jgi:hypothetical protein
MPPNRAQSMARAATTAGAAAGPGEPTTAPRASRPCCGESIHIPARCSRAAVAAFWEAMPAPAQAPHCTLEAAHPCPRARDAHASSQQLAAA